MAKKGRTRSAAAKRFKVTPTGKVMRRHAGRSHLLTKKSSRRKRRMAGEVPLSSSDARRALRMLSGQR